MSIVFSSFMSFSFLEISVLIFSPLMCYSFMITYLFINSYCTFTLLPCFHLVKSFTLWRFSISQLSLTLILIISILFPPLLLIWHIFTLILTLHIICLYNIIIHFIIFLFLLWILTILNWQYLRLPLRLVICIIRVSIVVMHLVSHSGFHHHLIHIVLLKHYILVW